MEAHRPTIKISEAQSYDINSFIPSHEIKLQIEHYFLRTTEKLKFHLAEIYNKTKFSVCTRDASILVIIREISLVVLSKMRMS